MRGNLDHGRFRRQHSRVELIVALKSTVYKADLHIADMDRQYYQQHSLTLARHPSETEERLMVRLLAFALYATERLEFGQGLSTDDEPDLWLKDLTGAIELWIDVGLPDERQIRKACGRAERVVLLTYGGRSAELWWEQNRSKLERQQNLSVIDLPNTEALAGLAARGMQVSCNVQDGQLWFSSEAGSVEIIPRPLLLPKFSK